MITIEGVEVPNLISELTVEQFDKFNNIEGNKDLDVIEKWITKFTYLGVPEEVFDDYTMEQFVELKQNFDVKTEVPQVKVLSIEVDGYTYEAKPQIGVKDLSLIEKKWKHDLANFASECLAILFKRSDLSRKEHYANAHIKHKANLFKGLKAELAIPYVLDVQKVLTANAEKVVKDAKDEATK